MILYENCSQKSTRKSPPKQFHLWRIRGESSCDAGGGCREVFAATANDLELPNVHEALAGAYPNDDGWYSLTDVAYVGPVRAGFTFDDLPDAWREEVEAAARKGVTA